MRVECCMCMGGWHVHGRCVREGMEQVAAFGVPNVCALPLAADAGCVLVPIQHGELSGLHLSWNVRVVGSGWFVLLGSSAYWYTLRCSRLRRGAVCGVH